jgi:hypothetical protein
MSPPSSKPDGRTLDRRIADERGEGATSRGDEPDAAWPVPRLAEPSRQEPSDTYYDLPVVKAAPWRWYISFYFHAGGVAGAAATLAAAAELARAPRLARRLHGIASVGEALGAACLIADLGKPARFHYMMRVFRPTSPMNLGTWILSAASASGGLALLGSLRGRRGLGAASATSSIAGAMLATYTAVLLGNTAIPIWDATRRRLPLWFAATSAASLASLLELFGWAPRGGRGYSLVAKAGELASAHAVERAAEAAGVARPLREGCSGRMWRGARWLGIASFAATVLDRPRLAGALGTAAAVLARFAIVEAGRSSAADPRATFVPQRRAAGKPSVSS